MQTKLLIVDDHAILLDGMTRLFQDDEELQVVATLGKAADALRYLGSNAVDVVITDYTMPDMDGLSFVRSLRASGAQVKVIVLSMHLEVHLITEILRAGANAYVSKTETHEELRKAVHAVLRGEQYLSHSAERLMAENAARPEPARLLTDREMQVMKMIAQGSTNKEIAVALHISDRTVETHRKNILKKTNTHSVVSLINFARKNNLLTD